MASGCRRSIPQPRKRSCKWLGTLAIAEDPVRTFDRAAHGPATARTSNPPCRPPVRHRHLLRRLIPLSPQGRSHLEDSKLVGGIRRTTVSPTNRVNGPNRIHPLPEKTDRTRQHIHAMRGVGARWHAMARRGRALECLRSSCGARAWLGAARTGRARPPAEQARPARCARGTQPRPEKIIVQVP